MFSNFSTAITHCQTYGGGEAKLAEPRDAGAAQFLTADIRYGMYSKFYICPFEHRINRNEESSLDGNTKQEKHNKFSS